MVIVPNQTKKLNVELSVLLVCFGLLCIPEVMVLYLMAGVCVFMGLEIRPKKLSAASVGVMFYWLTLWPWVAFRHWKG